ncbi:MAG: 3-oxo-5-alpha-steroid 4-dehydrogenase, partial [Promethearchaeota archaeon]
FFIIGTIIWICGFIINIYSDYILRNLREPGENGYKIPYGGLFRFVSCPNYLGEILEWIGWAVLTWSISGLVFALWTIANLIPRAISHHRWYHQHFEEYPQNRKAIIPFIL